MNPIQMMLSRTIEQYGMAIQFVFPTEEHPGHHFAYTIGMTDIGQPELILFGCPQEVVGHVFNVMFAGIKEGAIPRDLDKIDDVLGVPLLAHKTTTTEASKYAVQCLEYYHRRGKQPEFKQLLWPDANGVYPHQDGFDEKYKQQQPYIACESSELTTEQISRSSDTPSP